MLPSVSLHGLVEAKVLNPGDQLCTPAQSAKLAPRIDIGIDCAPVIYFAVVDPRDDESVEIGHDRSTRGRHPRKSSLQSACATSSSVAIADTVVALEGGH